MAWLLVAGAPAWAQADPGPWRFDLAWHYQHYSEPNMHLAGHGLQAGAQRQLTPTAGWMPSSLQASLGVARLGYGSKNTGKLSGVASLQWQMGAWWQLPQWAGLPWQTGPVLEGQWTDLRGQSSTGHRGYERHGVRAWWALAVSPAPGARLSAAALLRGQQHSQLSQANTALPNVVNTQKAGWWLQLELAPVAPWFGLQPWLELKRLESSDKQGRQGWYEPQNTHWQMGLRKRF